MLLEAREIHAIERLAKRTGDRGFAVFHEYISLDGEAVFPATRTKDEDAFTTGCDVVQRPRPKLLQSTSREQSNEQQECRLARRGDSRLRWWRVTAGSGSGPGPAVRCAGRRIHRVDLHRHRIVPDVPAVYAAPHHDLLSQ